MRETQTVTGRETTREKSSVVRRKSQVEAARYIIELAGHRQGFNHIAIGSRGKGKTWWLDKLAAMAASQFDYVLIHDVKNRDPQYQGEVYERIGDVVTRPPKRNTLLFRRASPESVARYGWRLGEAQRPKTSFVLIDEVYDALSSAMHFASGDASCIAQISRKGRSRGTALAATTQIPQALPTVLTDLADTKAFFGMDSRSLNYCEGAMRLDKRTVEAIRRLQVGEFILITQGVDWDGTIYGPN